MFRGVPLQCVQVPGNIRRAEHFCSFLRQLVGYMRERISVQAVEQESCTAFLAALQEQMSVDGAPPSHLPHPVTVHGGAGTSPRVLQCCASPFVTPIVGCPLSHDWLGYPHWDACVGESMRGDSL